MTVRNHRFRGKRYAIQTTARVIGQCIRPNETYDGEIYIDPRQRPRQSLDTVVHEALHALFPHETEHSIDQAAHDLSSLLWRMGYKNVYQRKTKEDHNGKATD